jgi:diguanylate cyclase (GGDEF)-like protein/PAS domain S-box-containing protein
MIHDGSASESKTDLLFKTIIDNLPALVYRLSIRQNGRMEFFNDMIQSMTGYSHEELTRGEVCSIEPLILPEDKQAVAEEVKDAIRENRPFWVEYKIKHKCGDIRCFAETGKPVYGSDGAAEYIDGLIFDITERKQAEEKLREKDIRLDKLASQAPGMLYQFMRRSDGTYCVPFTTEAIRDIFGCSPQEVREDFSPIARIILPEDVGQVFASIEKSAKHLTPWRCEYRVMLSGDSVHWLWGQAMPERLRDGSILWHGFNTDITERKQTELLYRGLAEKSLAGVYVVQDRKFRFINANAAHYAGYLPEELTGKDSTTIVYPADKELVRNYAEEMLSGRRTDPYEFRIVTKQGNIRWIMETVTAIFYQGKPAILGNSMDVTEKKRYEEKLQRMLLSDQLTNLYNRRGFMTLAEQQIRGANRAKKRLLLAFIDVDDMKSINDTLGHEEGDRALIETADVLRQTFRESDILARIGGDEFAVLAVDATDMNPAIFAVRLETNINSLNANASRPYKLAMSWGTAIYDPESPISLDQLMSIADELMYAQKKSKINEKI